MSLFTQGMDPANDTFGATAGETFTVVRGGIPGDYAAKNIDELTATQAVQPGGIRADNNVTMFVDRAVLTASEVKDNAVLIVRGNRVRVTNIGDEGDNTLIITCTSVGVKF